MSKTVKRILLFIGLKIGELFIVIGCLCHVYNMTIFFHEIIRLHQFKWLKIVFLFLLSTFIILFVGITIIWMCIDVCRWNWKMVKEKIPDED